VAKKVDAERQYTSLGNKLAIKGKRSASAVITQEAVKTPLPTLSDCVNCEKVCSRESVAQVKITRKRKYGLEQKCCTGKNHAKM
jgi:hypothetical protein